MSQLKGIRVEEYHLSHEGLCSQPVIKDTEAVNDSRLQDYYRGRLKGSETYVVYQNGVFLEAAAEFTHTSKHRQA